jgi:hypothetical protein
VNAAATVSLLKATKLTSTYGCLPSKHDALATIQLTYFTATGMLLHNLSD